MRLKDQSNQLNKTRYFLKPDNYFQKWLKWFIKVMLINYILGKKILYVVK